MKTPPRGHHRQIALLKRGFAFFMELKMARDYKAADGRRSPLRRVQAMACGDLVWCVAIDHIAHRGRSREALDADECTVV